MPPRAPYSQPASGVSMPNSRAPSAECAPCALAWLEASAPRRVYRVRRIYEHWRERRAWWAQPLDRDYYRLEDVSGMPRVVYLDRRTQQWWLVRHRL